MGSPQDRCEGALWGLAAGDKNGGPIRMAVLLAESLIEKEKFDKDDVVKRYDDWYNNKDEEPCFDTGGTFVSVFKRMSQVW